MEIKLYFQMLRRGWWFVALGVLLSLTVSLVISFLTESTYTSTASFIITPSLTLTNGPDVVNGLEVLGNTSVVSTYAEVMNSNRVYNATLEFLHLQNEDLLDYTYQAVALPSTSVVELSVSGPNPSMAADIANALGHQTIVFIRKLNRAYDIEFLDAATPSTVPIAPKPLRDAGLAVILGMVAGAGLVILREEIRIPIEAYRQRLRIDSVTGVYNNKYFLRLIEEEMAENPGNVMSIAIVELNELRDLLGTLPVASLHRLLQKVTESLQKELRGNDAIGRWDDVSFIIMLPNTSGTSANRIFERIYQVLSIPAELGYLNSAVTLDPHVGGAEYSNDISPQDLIEKAKEALTQARRDSENPVCIWSMKNPFWAQNDVAQLQ